MYIPIHNLAEKMNPDMCKVIFPLHHLTVCDSTSKFGTNAAGLNETPDKYLQDFGKDITLYMSFNLERSGNPRIN